MIITTPLAFRWALPREDAMAESNQQGSNQQGRPGRPTAQDEVAEPGSFRAMVLDFQDTSQEWRRLFSEFLGTFFLVLVAAGGGMMGQAFPGTISRTAAVVAPGLMVMGVILFMGKVSGAHLNPAVSFAFALRGDFPWQRVPGYIVVQLAGAALAAWFLQAVINVSAVYGSNYPAPNYSNFSAFLMEIVLTFGLVGVILGTASGAQNIGVIGALGVASYIALAGLWGSPISGASMNPARTFGPDLIGASFGSYWVYIAGPLGGDVDPVATEVRADQVGTEGAGGVHRRAGDRAAPQTGQCDVAGHAQRSDDPDVLGAGGGPEDHADQSEGEHGLHQERAEVRIVGCGVVGAVDGRHVDHGLQEPGGERRTGQLDHDVPRDALPREVTAQREREAHRRVQVRAGHLAHEQDDAHHHQPRRHDGRGAADGARERLSHHPAAGGHQHQEERSEELGEQPPPFLGGVLKVQHHGAEAAGLGDLVLCGWAAGPPLLIRPLLIRPLLI